MGNAAAGCLCWTGTGSRGVGDCYQTEMALCGRPALGLVAGPGGDCNADVRRGTAEDLEQHAHRNEPRAPPTTFAEGAHGRAVEPDQPTLFVQYIEHCLIVDSI